MRISCHQLQRKFAGRRIVLSVPRRGGLYRVVLSLCSLVFFGGFITSLLWTDWFSSLWVVLHR